MFYKKMVFQFFYGIMGTIMNNKTRGRCLNCHLIWLKNNNWAKSCVCIHMFQCLPSCNYDYDYYFVVILVIYGHGVSGGVWRETIVILVKCIRVGRNQTLRALLCYVLYWYRCSYTLLCGRRCVESLFRTQTAMKRARFACVRQRGHVQHSPRLRPLRALRVWAWREAHRSLCLAQVRAELL